MDTQSPYRSSSQTSGMNISQDGDGDTDSKDSEDPLSAQSDDSTTAGGT